MSRSTPRALNVVKLACLPVDMSACGLVGAVSACSGVSAGRGGSLGTGEHLLGQRGIRPRGVVVGIIDADGLLVAAVSLQGCAVRDMAGKHRAVIRGGDILAGLAA